MNNKRPIIFLTIIAILGIGLPSYSGAQTENTWLSIEGGWLGHDIKPMEIRSPVYQQGKGAGLGLALYYDLRDKYHRGEVSYLNQPSTRLFPADIRSSLDRYISLALNYQYTRFHFQDIGNLNLDFGSGPYVFVRDQTSNYSSDNGSTIVQGNILYGGGIHLVLRYQHPDIPFRTDLYFVNGGFLGRQETDRRNTDYENTSANGWFSVLNLEAGYKLSPDWRIYLSYNGSEQLEYRSPYDRRRTLQQVSFGISYRLEDD